MSNEAFQASAVVESVDTGAKMVVLIPVMYHTEPELEETLHAAIAKYGRDRIRRRGLTRTTIWTARDILAHAFLNEYDAEYCLFVDGDMVVPTGMPNGLITRLRSLNPIRPDQAAINFIERMVNHDPKYGVIGAAYFDRQGGASLQVSMGVGSLEVNGFNERYRRGQVRGILPCDWVATGGMRIHRRVFAKIRAESKRFPEIVPSNPKNPWGFFTPNRVNCGEDVSFPVSTETPVLGHDWKWRPIATIAPGETVLGFDEHSPKNSSRRFRPAVVNGIVNRFLPRFRIVTSQREIITTAEHPWLSKRPMSCQDKRPWRWHATQELGAGALIASIVPPEANPDISHHDYCRGYLRGMFDSDGTIVKVRDYHNYVIRMKDVEAIERSSTCFATLGIESVRGPMKWDGNYEHAKLHALGVYRKAFSQTVADLLRDYDLGNPRFAAGYLAAMFDSDGHHDGSRITISSIVDAKKDRMQLAARTLGLSFDVRDERTVRMNSQAQRLRFWQLAAPAIARKCLPRGQRGNDGVIRGLEVRHADEVIQAIEPIGRGEVMCLTTTSGTFIADGLASHNCYRAKHAGEQIYFDADCRLMHKAVIFN